MADAGDESRREHRRARLGRPSGRRPEPDRGERDESDRPERRQQRPEREQQPAARLTPRQSEPGSGERRVDDREAERDVPERQHRHREGDRESEALAVERGRRRGDREPDRPAVREEGQRRRRPAGEERREPGRGDPARRNRRRHGQLDPAAARAFPSPCGGRAAQRSASSAADGPPRRVRARAHGRRAGASASAGRDGARTAEPRRPRSRGPCGASTSARTGAGPASASQSITPTAQTSAASVASSPASRSGAMYASVPGTSPCAVSVSASAMRASPKSSSRTETRVAVGEQDVRRLDVAVEDPRAMRVREPFADLGAALDRSVVVQLPGAQRLAERASGDELVGDVDVARVAREGVGAETARMPQPRRRVRLPLGAGRRLALAGDDLERDVEPVLLVAGQPDRAGAARPGGRSGSGSVWLARDEEPTRRRAQDRCPRGKGGGPREREAHAAARLRHRLLSPRLCLPRATRATSTSAYEFVPGRTFREAMRAGELNDHDAVEAAPDPEGLAHARTGSAPPRRQAVERRRRRGLGALSTSPRGTMAEALLTAQGDVPGTLAYVAQEAARRRGRDGGRRRFGAVGVMLWEALASQHVSGRRRCSTRPARSRPERLPLSELRPDLPKPMLQLVAVALSLNPARRPSQPSSRGALAGASATRATETRAQQQGRAARGDGDSAGPDRRGRARGPLRRLDGGGAALLPRRWAMGSRSPRRRPRYRERLGLAVALAVPVLTGNVSLGLALGALRGLRRCVSRAAGCCSRSALCLPRRSRRLDSCPLASGRRPDGPLRRARRCSRRLSSPASATRPACHGCPCAPGARRRRRERSVRRASGRCSAQPRLSLPCSWRPSRSRAWRRCSRLRARYGRWGAAALGASMLAASS